MIQGIIHTFYKVKVSFFSKDIIFPLVRWTIISIDLHLWNTGLEETLYCTSKFRLVILTNVAFTNFLAPPPEQLGFLYLHTQDGKTACHCLDRYELPLISRL